MSIDRPVARTYGDVTAEYLAMRSSAGLVVAGYDPVIVAGPDSEMFLQGVVSQDLTAISMGEVTRSLLLGPQGKLQAVFWVLKGVDEFILLTERGRGGLLAGELERYRFRVDAAVTTSDHPALSVVGPEAAAVLTACGWPSPPGWERIDHGWIASAPLGGLPRFIASGVDPDLLIGAGARPVGSLAADAVRVEAGEPVMGRDIDEKTIPQESGLVHQTVSFDKGCYLGQELVARIDSRGRVNRHLRGVVIGANVLPPEQAEVWFEGAAVGHLTSVAESLTLRAPVGLALVRREVEPGERVEVRWAGGSAGATVRRLPLSDFTET
jgi:folate-binding protein YgfZ